MNKFAALPGQRDSSGPPLLARRFGWLLFWVSLTCSTVFAQNNDSTKTREQVKKAAKQSFRPKMSFEQFLAFTLPHLHLAAKSYRVYSNPANDTLSQKDRDRQYTAAASALFQPFVWFQGIKKEDWIFDDGVLEQLEFYDERVKTGIRWYAEFLGNPQFEAFTNAAPEELWQGNFARSGLDRLTILELRSELVDLCKKTLQQAETIPVEFRRKYSDRNKKYDEPAVPLGGYAVLQKSLNQAVTAHENYSAGIINVKALISETGKVLRTRVLKSSGSQSIDQAALKVVKSAKWRPSKFNGVPFKTDVIIPLRF